MSSCLACSMKPSGNQSYMLPSMEVVRFTLGDEVRTDVIVESDGSKWTDWYSLGNPEDPGVGEL